MAQTILSLSINDLKPYPHNARTHSKKQIRQIVDSITAFGFTNPVLIDNTKTIVAGHGRVEAAKLLGMETVPTLCLDTLSSDQIRAYIIADNKLAENAGWDNDTLAIELQALNALDLDFDLTALGFETPELDLLLCSTRAADDPLDNIPERQPDDAITQAGDLWQVAGHRLLCGSALEAGSYTRLLEGEDRAQMVFTDPPYNVPIDGHVSGLGDVKHREFAMATGEMTPDQFISFLSTALGLMAEHSGDGSIHFICMDWRHASEVLTAGGAIYTEHKNICVWAKTNGGMGSLYRSQHEMIFVFKAGNRPHINNVELGKHGRNRSNVWQYAGVNSFGAERETALAMHPTVKPAQMVADAILDCSHRGGLILDPFAGSGTTLVAAHQTGRRGFGIELDPLYCDVIVRRLMAVTGEDAIHVGTGESFDAQVPVSQEVA